MQWMVGPCGKRFNHLIAHLAPRSDYNKHLLLVSGLNNASGVSENVVYPSKEHLNMENRMNHQIWGYTIFRQTHIPWI